MKRCDLLDIAAEAISQRRPSPCGRWLLCYTKAKVMCIPTNSTCKPEVIFGVLTRLEVNRGLETDRWNWIESKMYTFLKGKGICQS